MLQVIHEASASLQTGRNVFLCKQEDTFLTKDWPLRSLRTARSTELREMPRFLACALIDLVGVALNALFEARKESRGPDNACSRFP